MLSATLPDFFKNNEKFDAAQSGYGVKVDNFIQKHEGFFLRAEHSIKKIKFQLIEPKEKINREAKLLGLRAGYKHRINKIFYVTPWIGIDLNISDTSTLKIAGKNYNLEKWIIFPTIHLGMRL